MILGGVVESMTQGLIGYGWAGGCYAWDGSTWSRWQSAPHHNSPRAMVYESGRQQILAFDTLIRDRGDTFLARRFHLLPAPRHMGLWPRASADAPGSSRGSGARRRSSRRHLRPSLPHGAAGSRSSNAGHDHLHRSRRVCSGAHHLRHAGARRGFSGGRVSHNSVSYGPCCQGGRRGSDTEVNL